MEPERDRTARALLPGRFSWLGGYLVVLVALLVWRDAGAFYERPIVSTAALLTAGLAWWISVARARSLPAQGSVLLWVVVGAVLLRVVGLLSQAELSDDLHRYVWEGELVRRGISPYSFAPSAPELSAVRDTLAYTFAHMNNTDVSAAYPPLAQAVFAAVTCALHPWLELAGTAQDPSAYERGVAGSLRILFALADLALLVPLVRWARASARGCAGVVAWAWCPLVVIEYSGSGHFDSLALLFWWSAVIGISLAGRALPRFQVGWLAAVLVKYLPVISLPWVLRGPRARASFVWLAAVGALAFVPFVALAGLSVRGLGEGLGQYGLRWESQSLTYRFVEASLSGLFERDGSWLDLRRMGRGTIALIWLAYAAWLFRRRADDPALSAGRLTGAFLILTPTLHPWYVTWIVPHLARSSSAAWCYLCVVAPLFYWPLSGWVERGEWIEPAWLWPTVALPFFALLLAGRIRSGS